MNKFIVADKDAYVGKRAAQGIEEHQITWLEVFLANLPALVRNGGGITGHAVADRLVEDITYESRAINTRLRILPTEPVPGIVQRQCCHHDVHRLRRSIDPRARYRWRLRSAASCQQAERYRESKNANDRHIVVFEKVGINEIISCLREKGQLCEMRVRTRGLKARFRGTENKD